MKIVAVSPVLVNCVTVEVFLRRVGANERGVWCDAGMA
jgi:hypothetical protein